MAKGVGTRDGPTRRPKAPPNTYWRGEVLWAKFKVRGQLYRESLRTSSPVTATKRLKALRDSIEDQVIYGESAPISWKRAFVDWHAAAPNNSTTQRYLTSLKQLRPWLDELDVQQVTHDTLRTIVAARRKLVSIATVNRDLTAISSVLDHAAGEGWVKDNAAATFDRSRLVERRDPPVLPEPEHINATIAGATAAFGAAIELSLETGMRQGEVFSLEWSQIDLKRRAATLYYTKRRRPRAVPLSPRAVAILKERPAFLKCPLVFWHGDGEGFASPAENFRNLIARVARQRAQSDEPFRPFTFHHLRHTFAVDYLKRRQGSIYDLQRILGHRSLTTTEIYLDYLTPEEARAVMIEGGAQNGAQVQRSGKRTSGASNGTTKGKQRTSKPV